MPLEVPPAPLVLEVPPAPLVLEASAELLVASTLVAVLVVFAVESLGGCVFAFWLLGRKEIIT